MQRMLAVNLVDCGPMSLMVIGVLVTWTGLGWAASRISLHRAVREFRNFPCPQCGKRVGDAAARAGKDVSPWEEIWGDDDDDGANTRHCHPTCRSVRCDNCATEFVLRLNRQGNKCGPRLSVRSRDEDGGQPAA